MYNFVHVYSDKKEVYQCLYTLLYIWEEQQKKTIYSYN